MLVLIPSHQSNATGCSPYFEVVWLRRKDEKEAVVTKHYTPQSGDRVCQDFDTPDDLHQSSRP